MSKERRHVLDHTRNRGGGHRGRGLTAPEMPAAWKQKIDHATKAREAGDDAKAEAILKEIVSEADKLGPNDLRLADLLVPWLGCTSRATRAKGTEFGRLSLCCSGPWLSVRRFKAQGIPMWQRLSLGWEPVASWA